MSRPRLAATIALAMLGFAGSAKAQTAYGPGGLFIHPTAFVRPAGVTTLNVSWFEQKQPGARTASWLPVSMVAGAGGRAEIGAIYLRRLDRASGASSGGAFAKYQLVPDGDHSPAVAVAGSYLGGSIQLSSLSVVASHRFGGTDGRFAAHLGAQWARRADISHSRNDVEPFVGGEVRLSRSISLIAEYGTRFDFDYKERSAVGLVWRGPRGYQLGVGAVNIGRSGEHRFFVGVGFPLGGNN